MAFSAGTLGAAALVAAVSAGALVTAALGDDVLAGAFAAFAAAVFVAAVFGPAAFVAAAFVAAAFVAGVFVAGVFVAALALPVPISSAGAWLEAVVVRVARPVPLMADAVVDRRRAGDFSAFDSPSAAPRGAGTDAAVGSVASCVAAVRRIR